MEFWRLLWWEFQLMREAHNERELGELKFRAAMTANLMNCWIKKSITAEMLLGLDRKKSKALRTPIGNAKFARLCRDSSGEPIWQKLEEASQRAEAERGKQAASTTARM